jgi:hypothetical protein
MIGEQAFRAGMAALMVGILTTSAHAYLDPGTGSMILQVLLGGVAGLALAGKLYWHKLLSLLGIRKSEAEIVAHDNRTSDGSARR